MLLLVIAFSWRSRGGNKRMPAWRLHSMLPGMKVETLVFGLLPTIIALGAVVLSLYVAFKARRIYQYAASGFVVAAVAWSLLVLYAMFVGHAWPTYLPYLVIGGAAVMVVAQTLVLRTGQRGAA